MEDWFYFLWSCSSLIGTVKRKTRCSCGNQNTPNIFRNLLKNYLLRQRGSKTATIVELRQKIHDILFTNDSDTVLRDDLLPLVS